MIHSVGSRSLTRSNGKPIKYWSNLPIGSVSRTMSTGRKKVFPNPSLFDPLPDVPTDPGLLKGVRSFFDSNRKEPEPKFSILLHKTVESICPNLSPQESFEYRLVSCIGSLCNPVGAITSNDDKGIAYRVTDADWQSLDEEAIAFVERDDRYNVDWVPVAKDHVDGNTIIFKPKVPLPQKQVLDPHGPSDPQVLEKARWLFERAEQRQVDALADFYKNFAEVCDLMSPKDSFTFRLEARSYFGSPYNFQSDCKYPEKVEDGLQYHVHHASSDFPDDFLKRYMLNVTVAIKWIGAFLNLEMLTRWETSMHGMAI